MRLRCTGFFKKNFGSRYYTEVSVENIHSQNKKIHPGTTFFLCLVAVFRKKKRICCTIYCVVLVYIPRRGSPAPLQLWLGWWWWTWRPLPRKKQGRCGAHSSSVTYYILYWCMTKENGVALGRYRRGLSSFQRKTDASLEVLSRKSAFFFFLVFSLEKNRLVRGMGGVSVI